MAAVEGHALTDRGRQIQPPTVQFDILHGFTCVSFSNFHRAIPMASYTRRRAVFRGFLRLAEHPLRGYIMRHFRGEMPEWPNGAVSKTANLATGSGVQIPLSPPVSAALRDLFQTISPRRIPGKTTETHGRESQNAPARAFSFLPPTPLLETSFESPRH